MDTNKTILVTGGAGYIGSHTCIKLLDAGYAVVVLDNFSNSSPEALRRVEDITGKTTCHYSTSCSVIMPSMRSFTLPG